LSGAKDVIVAPFPATMDREQPYVQRENGEEEEEEEDEESEYDDMPPLVEMARPLEPSQSHLHARLKLRNPLNLPPTSHFYKALNGLQSIELNVSRVKEELLSAKLETEYIQANNPRKME